MNNNAPKLKRPFPAHRFLAFICALISSGCVTAFTGDPFKGLAIYFALACIIFAIGQLNEGK